MNIASLYSQFIENQIVITDSRNISAGSVYFALRGERFDGNAFVSQALEKGARLAVIDNKDFYIDTRTILVEDSLITLQQLANFHRHKLGIPIIGITGSNGKTTTKELIREVLAKRYKVFATQGNLNNHIGVPLTLLSMTSEIQVGIVEMGANHPLEIKQLCEIAEPNYGIITNIGKAHLEGFGGFQGVIKTKKELYDFVEQAGGTVFYNSDNQLLSDIVNGLRVKSFTYGANTGSLCKGSVISASPFLHVGIESISDGAKVEEIEVKTNLVGVYNFENILAASCTGLFFNVPFEEIGKAISDYKPSNNRSQLYKTQKNRLLLDCYNANPSSTEAAINNFTLLQEKDKLIILGDMLELGEETNSEHRRILHLLTSQTGIRVILVGKIYKELAKEYGFLAFTTSEELKKWLGQNPVENHFILLKGSRGIQLEKTVESL